MDDQTPFKMPPFTGRNILIFSDGTGQAGGLLPDESRSNVYKLYRATRCGPVTRIDPDKQLGVWKGSDRGRCHPTPQMRTATTASSTNAALTRNQARNVRHDLLLGASPSTDRLEPVRLLAPSSNFALSGIGEVVARTRCQVRPNACGYLCSVRR